MLTSLHSLTLFPSPSHFLLFLALSFVITIIYYHSLIIHLVVDTTVVIVIIVVICEYLSNDAFRWNRHLSLVTTCLGNSLFLLMLNDLSLAHRQLAYSIFFSHFVQCAVDMRRGSYSAGGALLLSAIVNFTVSDCIFKDNRARAGALQNYGSEAEGGAITLEYCRHGTIEKSTFNGNEALGKPLWLSVLISHIY